MLNLRIIFLTTILLELLRLGESYIITVDSREEECFFERGPKMSKFSIFQKKQLVSIINVNFVTGLMFEVIDGGFNDIEVSITDPKGVKVHEAEEASGKYTFGTGSPDDTFTYCFINKKGSQVPKTVMFNMDVIDAGRAAGPPAEKEVGHNKLEDMVMDSVEFIENSKKNQKIYSILDSRTFGWSDIGET